MIKDYQQLIGSVIIAVAIVIASLILGDAVEYAGATAGSQIASALNIMTLD